MAKSGASGNSKVFNIIIPPRSLNKISEIASHKTVIAESKTKTFIY